MQLKKTQVAPEQDDRAPLLEAAHANVRERGRRQGFVADLTSIVSAAHELAAEVDPPARVWVSLRAQLEKEGILSCSVRGKLQKHTKFPMLTKIRERGRRSRCEKKVS